MTDAGRRESKKLGLDRELSWACDACLAAHRYVEPPDGWGGSNDRWPFRDQ